MEKLNDTRNPITSYMDNRFVSRNTQGNENKKIPGDKNTPGNGGAEPKPLSQNSDLKSQQRIDFADVRYQNRSSFIEYSRKNRLSIKLGLVHYHKNGDIHRIPPTATEFPLREGTSLFQGEYHQRHYYREMSGFRGQNKREPPFNSLPVKN